MLLAGAPVLIKYNTIPTNNTIKLHTAKNWFLKCRKHETLALCTLYPSHMHSGHSWICSVTTYSILIYELRTI